MSTTTSNEPLKLCVNCAHCNTDNNKQCGRRATDLVTGDYKPSGFITTLNERMQTKDPNRCGVDGKYFTPAKRALVPAQFEKHVKKMHDQMNKVYEPPAVASVSTEPGVMPKTLSAEELDQVQELLKQMKESGAANVPDKQEAEKALKDQVADEKEDRKNSVQSQETGLNDSIPMPADETEQIITDSPQAPAPAPAPESKPKRTRAKGGRPRKA